MEEKSNISTMKLSDEPKTFDEAYQAIKKLPDLSGWNEYRRKNMALNFTERYLKMCKKAYEIQKDYIFHYGDYCIITKYKHEQIAILQMYEKTKYKYILMFNNGCSVMVISDYLILIPRQDQLQRMVTDESVYPSDDLYKLKAKFESWLEYEPPHTSYNELWLAFVMKEKYNKVWSDKKENWENDSVG